MTIEEIAHDDCCVNCNADTRNDNGSHEVAGWGVMCDWCYEAMLELRTHAVEIYESRWG